MKRLLLRYCQIGGILIALLSWAKYRKLGARRRTEAVQVGREDRLLPCPSHAKQ